MNAWPGWAHERVEVRPADPAWQQRGVELCRSLEVALASWLTTPVEHVGSTAVPGLSAKPVLDVQAAAADLGCAPDIAAVLAPGGWHHVPPELDGRPWRRFLVQVADDRRIAHLHLLAAGSAHWQEQLAFRDALRADDSLARRYGALKAALASRHPDDREAYTEGKAEFVRTVLAGPAPEAGPTPGPVG